MTVTAADLAAYVNADAADPFVAECVEVGQALVDAYAGATAVPGPVLDQAVCETASELFNRRQAPNGVAQFASQDASPVFVARDPMVRAYPLLDRYVMRGIA